MVIARRDHTGDRWPTALSTDHFSNNNTSYPHLDPKTIHIPSSMCMYIDRSLLLRNSVALSASSAFI